MKLKHSNIVVDGNHLLALITQAIAAEIPKHLPATITMNDEVLTTKEAAKFLKLSIPFVTKLSEDGILHCVRNGRKRHFLKSKLITYMLKSN